MNSTTSEPSSFDDTSNEEPDAFPAIDELSAAYFAVRNGINLLVAQQKSSIDIIQVVNEMINGTESYRYFPLNTLMVTRRDFEILPSCLDLVLSKLIGRGILYVENFNSNEYSSSILLDNGIGDCVIYRIRLNPSRENRLEFWNRTNVLNTEEFCNIAQQFLRTSPLTQVRLVA